MIHALLLAVSIYPDSHSAARALEQWYPSRQSCYLPIPPKEKEKIAIENALEIIENYLYAVNKTQFLKEANVPRSTVYNFCKRRNPTIKTLAKILHASAQ